MKFKLSLLIPLLLLIAIPVTLKYIQRPQLLRKQADEPPPSADSTPCTFQVCIPTPANSPTPTPTPPVCHIDDDPSLEFVSPVVDHQSQVIIKKTVPIGYCYEFEFYVDGQLKSQSSGFVANASQVTSIQLEHLDQDQITTVSARIRLKQTIDLDCDLCQADNGNDCCIGDWVTITDDCIGCKEPSIAQVNLNSSDPTKVDISWQDQSNIEAGFVVYACPKGSGNCVENRRYYWIVPHDPNHAPSDTFITFTPSQLDPNLTAQDFVDNYDCVVRCFTTCGGGFPDLTSTPTGPVTNCVYPDLPTISKINHHDFANPVYFSWTSNGANYLKYTATQNGTIQSQKTYGPGNVPASGIEIEAIDIDAVVNITAKVESIATAAGTDPQDCTEDNGTTCCIVEATATACTACRNPTNLTKTRTPNTCSAINDYGTNLDWTDRSSLESGFAIYRCPAGSAICPTSSNQYIGMTTRNDTSYTDCDTAYGPEYSVQCYTLNCGNSPADVPTTTPPPPSISPTPSPTSSPQPSTSPSPSPSPTPDNRPTNTPVPPNPTHTPAPGQPTNTPAPTNTSVPLPTVPSSTPAIGGGQNTPVPANQTTNSANQIAQASPTRIELIDAGIDFPAKSLAIVGTIVTLLGLLIFL